MGRYLYEQSLCGEVDNMAVEKKRLIVHLLAPLSLTIDQSVSSRVIISQTNLHTHLFLEHGEIKSSCCIVPRQRLYGLMIRGARAFLFYFFYLFAIST